MSSAPEIPLDLRLLMQDCILALFWPKKKIIEFLKSAGVPDVLVAPSDTSLARHEIITETFARLGARPDRGYLAFQTMIDRLSNWSYFDPYYFDNIKKLDRTEAQTKIRQLKDAVESRNSSTEKRRTAAAESQKLKTKTADLSALKNAFGKLYGNEPSAQTRGRLFERFLKELFDRQSISMGDAFNLVGEQIDGTFKFEGENYIVEAKWLSGAAATEDLYKFAVKVDGKMYGRGMFVSVNGFTGPGFEAIVHGKHIKTILIDGADISFVLEGRMTLEQMLDYKIRAAQTRGDIYVCSIRQASKL